MSEPNAKSLRKERPDLWLLTRPEADPAHLQQEDLIYNQEAENKFSILAWEDKESAGKFWKANQDQVGEWKVASVTFAQFQKFLGTLSREQREMIFLRMG